MQLSGNQLAKLRTAVRVVHFWVEMVVHFSVVIYSRAKAAISDRNAVIMVVNKIRRTSNSSGSFVSVRATTPPPPDFSPTPPATTQPPD
jgi:ABC-type proline/glycine betaine transport system permease subunit